jgi:hypothetical protein
MPKSREGGAEKKDRHSTDKLGYRAHDRKEGFGGWGVPGDEANPAPAAVDKKDPNYDDERAEAEATAKKEKKAEEEEAAAK